jgi:HPt (histidine-containing phosphotransfer) domain-containing protein
MTTPSPESQPEPSKTQIRSAFADDPDMAEIVQLFVQEMPQRIEQLTQHWQQQRLDDVRRLAHQLKGSAGGYGFEPVGAMASGVEATLSALSEGSSRANMEQLRQQFEDLINVCRRVSV